MSNADGGAFEEGARVIVVDPGEKAPLQSRSEIDGKAITISIVEGEEVLADLTAEEAREWGLTTALATRRTLLSEAGQQ